MMTVVCYLISSSRVSSVHGFDNMTLLFSVTPILGVLSENNRVMVPKSQMGDTSQKLDNTQRSPILSEFMTYLS
jgi:hypothetical protein